MESKLFHLGDVVTVATCRLVSPRHIIGVCDILQFMTGECPYTHQIPRFMQECQPAILRQYPQFSVPAFALALAELNLITQKKTGDVKEEIDEWLLKIMQGEFGVVGLPLCGSANSMLEVQKLSPDEHERIDPESELLEMKPSDKIISVKL